MQEGSPIFKSTNLVIRPTVFGDVAIVWSERKGSPGIDRIILPRSGITVREEARRLFGQSGEGSCHEIDKLAEGIEKFCEGADIGFNIEILNLGLCSDFQQMVLRAEYSIPYGFVSTYRRIAGHIGRQKGARAVGNALANNPFPIVVPCHRAIRSDMTIGGYQGGQRMKVTLLENEGGMFDSKMRMIEPSIYYMER